jgi:hypothetical protein
LTLAVLVAILIYIAWWQNHCARLVKNIFRDYCKGNYRIEVILCINVFFGKVTPRAA